MRKLPLIMTTIFVLSFLSACANSHHVDRQGSHQFVTQFYAWVENVDKIKFQSDVNKNIVIGVVDGVLNNARGDRHDMLAGAIIGGMFGGLITALFEGSTTGYEYELLAVDGDVVSVIVEDKEAVEGQCVSVKVAGDVRITLQPTAACEHAAKDY